MSEAISRNNYSNNRQQKAHWELEEKPTSCDSDSMPRPESSVLSALSRKAQGIIWDLDNGAIWTHDSHLSW